ncbi:tyrosine-protein phosphatase, partial [Mycobacterium tuberculosis]|nr:tyrosine-protein phosphatase [Mycobacterium tuberculosis]
MFGEAFRVVADPCNMPSLVHCAAGKDRTGVFTALLLSALNVPSAAIVADYTLTGILRPDRYRAYADRDVTADV